MSDEPAPQAGGPAQTAEPFRSDGEPVDIGVVEEAGVAYDPTAQHLDLTKDEKRRTTALMLGIQAYKELIIKDAGMYTELRRDNRALRPATIDAMIEAAIRFDAFIAGRCQVVPADDADDGAEAGSAGLPDAAAG